ncbi:MAG: hypothetical protein IKP76_01270 [Bacilli bacterium]|nr:hypothetical protein [Bacilli bacterium]
MNNKGLNIVWILLILVLISIACILIIPNSIKMYNNLKKDIFVSYANDVIDASDKTYTASSSDRQSEIYVYELNKDLKDTLKIDNSYEGFIVIDVRDINVKYILYIHNKDYQIIGKDVTGTKITRNDLQYYNKNDWLNLKNLYQVCRTYEKDVSFDCLNKEGYIIAQ